MESWERTYPRRSFSNPSFSSTLLDAICRSMDDNKGNSRSGHSYREHPRASKHTQAASTLRSETVAFRGNNELAAGASNHSRKLRRDPYFPTSASSSPTYRCLSSYSAGSCSASNTPRLRAIRVATPPPRSPPAPELKKPRQTASIRSKFRPSKLYGDLKKPKSPSTTSPASPAARVAAFINALFASARHAKKAKITTSTSNSSSKEFVGGRGYYSAPSTACSSASSSNTAARSCLAKTPSSRGKAETMPASGARRSVRFYPVSLILDEECRPCGQKCIFDDHSIQGGGTRSVETLASRSVAKPARAVMITDHMGKRGMEVDHGGADDDARSDSSSDLFELENFAVIGGGGGGRYVGELPLYETTHLSRNRTTTRGLIVM